MIYSRHHLLNIKLSNTALHGLDLTLENANRICFDMKISVPLRLVSNQIHCGLFDHRITDSFLSEFFSHCLFGRLQASLKLLHKWFIRGRGVLL